MRRPGLSAQVRGRVRLGWLLELLEGYGFEPPMVHPLQCKAIASARLKTDKVDAATLVRHQQAGWAAVPGIAPVAAVASRGGH